MGLGFLLLFFLPTASFCVMHFSDLEHDEQAGRLRTLAESALTSYGLDGAPVRLLAHSATTTFRVDDPGGGRFVLRVHPASQGEALLRSEQAWLDWLCSRRLQVPRPVAAQDGRWLVPASAAEVPGPRLCQLTRWVEGVPLESILTPELYGQVGGFAARLHDAAEAFTAPEDFVRPGWDCSNLPAQVPDQGFPLLSRHQHEMMCQAARNIEKEVSSLGRDPQVFGIIHSDLQPANILIHQGEVRAIDFADCGWGHYLFDIAASILRFAGRSDFDVMRRAFLQGYRGVRKLPEESESYLPALMAARGIYVTAWVAQHWQSPSIRRYGEEVIPYILGLTRSYLDRSGLRDSEHQPQDLQTMTTVEFLSHLRSLGIDLQAIGDRLRFSAAKGTLTPTLRAELSQRKSDILRLLQQ